MKSTRAWFLAGIAFAGMLGLPGGALVGAAITFSDPLHRETAAHLVARAGDGRGCSDLGSRSERAGSQTEQTEILCLGVARTELAPGHTITRADLRGIRIPIDYVTDKMLPDPIGAVVTRRILVGESVRAERVQGGTP